MADEYKTGPGSRLVIRVDKPTTGQGQPAPGSGGGGEDEGQQGFLEPPRLARDVFVPPDEGVIELMDLGTRIVANVPYSYRELSLFYPVQYDISGIGPTDVGAPQFRLTTEQWAALDAELLSGPDPLSYTTVGGRKMPNVLSLNADAPLGRHTRLDLYKGNSYAPANRYVLDGGPADGYWRWVSKELPSEEWAGEVTEQGLAPHQGKYVSRTSLKWFDAFMYDDPTSPSLRYENLWFGGANNYYKLTAVPNFAAPAQHPKLKFPLRMLGRPVLYRPSEVSFCRARTQGDVVGGAARMFGWAIIAEYGVNFTTRLPQIPVPGQPPSEAWLAMFPPEALTTLRRVSSWRTRPGVAGTTGATTSWQLIVGQRPKAQAVVREEARALSRAVAEPVLGLTTFTESNQSLGWVIQLTPPPGRLRGIMETAGKAYYVWKG